MEKVVYRRQDRRLAQFRPLTTQLEFWEDRWSQHQLQDTLRAYSGGKLDEFEDLFSRYLPRDLPVLEAGCGLGQLVMALSARGYQIEGVDYAATTIARIQEVAPQLNVRLGDVYHLAVPDETYGGYISIGIFEHNARGPLDGLNEVHRVLRPDGVALISVPYLNRPRQRRLREVSSPYDAAPVGTSFYQYYFSFDEFSSLLRQANLEIVETFPYGVYSGLTRDFSLGRWLDQRQFFHWRVRRQLARWSIRAPLWMRWRWAHMIMFVCRRRQT